jgi:arylsulfatase A-like enzyme
MASGMHDFSGNRLPASAVTLAKVLHDNGYATAAFLGSAVLDSHFGLNQGFDTYFDHFDISRLGEANPKPMERRGDLVMDEALGWLKRNPRTPFMLWVHLFDPHFPYTPPEPYASIYKSRPYDGEIAFADAQVGRLLSFLKDTAILANSLIILAGDHGEVLGEHGEKTHGFFVYNSTLHVPLLIKVLGATPRVVEREVSLVDVMPTVLQAVSIPAPSSVQGRSLLSEVLGRAATSPSNLYAETYLPLLHFRWSQLRSLQGQGLKYIEAPRPEIYDTRTDPHELHNLYGLRKALAHEMRDRLFGVIRRFTPVTPAGSDAAKEPTDPALLERLRSLGYVAISAGTFTEASGKPLPDPKDRVQVYELVTDAMADCQHGRFQESLRKLGEAEKIEPPSLPIRYFKGLDYFGMNDPLRAAENFRLALQLGSKFTLAVYYLGLTEVRLGELDHAEMSFRHALELDPANFSAAFDLGAVLLRNKRVDEALQEFQRTVDINPTVRTEGEGASPVLVISARGQVQDMLAGSQTLRGFSVVAKPKHLVSVSDINVVFVDCDSER